MIKRGFWLILVLGMMVCPTGIPAQAENEPSAPAPELPISADLKKQPSPEEIRQMMQQTMGSLGDMLGLMMEGMAKTMAKPELAENYATFTRNYYDALITRGFTEEQALKIVTSDGLPTLGGGK